MFEPVKEETSGAAKALAVFAIGVLLSLGMCGLGATISSGPLSVMGALVFVICLLGCILSLLVIIIGKIIEYFSK
jgi:hypothetical protein